MDKGLKISKTKTHKEESHIFLKSPYPNFSGVEGDEKLKRIPFSLILYDIYSSFLMEGGRHYTTWIFIL